MEIKSKFNLGDSVYRIDRYSERVYKKCPICDGVGYAMVGEHRFTCTECNGCGGEYEYDPPVYHVNNEIGIIGRVQVTIYGKEWVERDMQECEITYMLDVTGVGSGTLHPEDQLFLTKEEAQAECDIRNEK